MINNDEQLTIPFTQLRGPKSAIEALTNVKGGMLAYGWTTDPDVDGQYGFYNEVTAAWEWGITPTSLPAPLELTDIITPSTLSAGVANDYSPTGIATCHLIRINVANNGDGFDGLDGGTSGRIIRIENINQTKFANIYDQNASASTTTMRFSLPDSIVSLSIPPRGVIDIIYDATISRWVLLMPGVVATSNVASGDIAVFTTNRNIRSDSVKVSTDGTMAANSDSLVATQKATRTFIASTLVGLLDDRGAFDASVNAYPSSGGSGTAGAILKGDIWAVSVAGTLPTAQVVEVGDWVRALVDTPGNTQANWAIIQNNIGYVAENAANKSNDTSMAADSATLYPTQHAAKTYSDSVSSNASVIAKVLTAFSAGAGTVTASDSILTALQKIVGNIAALVSVYIAASGWQEVSETWTRTGNHTFTVATDLTAKYRKGTKVRYKDGGAYEYGVVISSVFGAVTTVTLNVTSDFAMAATTITDTAISYIENPDGWPDYFNYVTTITSGSGTITTVTTNVARWNIRGRTLKAVIDFTLTNNGTGATSIVCTIGVTPANIGVGAGRNITTGGNQLSVACATATGANLIVRRYDNAYPGATGDTLRILAECEF